MDLQLTYTQRDVALRLHIIIYRLHIKISFYLIVHRYNSDYMK